MNRKAIILLSGGIDSSVCLAIAKSQGFQCYALSFDYHQRNAHELDCAALVARQIGVVEHRVLPCAINAWGGSSLTDLNMKVDDYAVQHVNTYVPARNTIFLSLALGWAEALGATDIFFAANAQDYENYPDCRPDFFAAFMQLANLATRAGVEGRAMQIHTPLIQRNKAQIIQQGRRLGVDFSLTFSCYSPINQTEPCQQCLACHLREQGFAQAPALKISG